MPRIIPVGTRVYITEHVFEPGGSWILGVIEGYWTRHGGISHNPAHFEDVGYPYYIRCDGRDRLMLRGMNEIRVEGDVTLHPLPPVKHFKRLPNQDAA